MVAAHSFRGSSLEDAPLSSLSEVHSPGTRRTHHQHNPGLEIILDIESRDWDFKVEAGMVFHLLERYFFADVSRGHPKNNHEPTWQRTEVYHFWIYHDSTSDS